MAADEIADRLDAAPAARRRTEQLPGDVAKPVGFAITAAKQIDQRFARQEFQRDLLGVLFEAVGLAAVLDDEIARDGEIADRRDEAPDLVAE